MSSFNVSFQKLNAKTDLNTSNIVNSDINATKTEKSVPNSVTETIDPLTFQSPISSNAQRTIQILENNDRLVVELESSDEDEVIEVALPPKPTITIESSDEDDLQVVQNEHSLTNTSNDAPITSSPNNVDLTKSQNNKSGEREISASPVPSGVSSISDEFIRSDCIALNISSRAPNRPSFDFSLHGADLLDQETPTKKKKKKKNKDKDSSTLKILSTPEKNNIPETLFATPKNKSKKKQKNKSLTEVTPKCNESDNHDLIVVDSGKKQRKEYSISDEGIPSADVYETDSNQSTIVEVNKDETVPASNDTNEETLEDSSKNKDISEKSDHIQIINKEIVDLTDPNDSPQLIEDLGEENIVMANVTGFPENDKYSSDNSNMELNKNPKLGSTKVPAILLDDLDFDNLKGNKMFCNRRYSLTTLRAEMDKFYNESWGGEDFNHREIQKYMSSKLLLLFYHYNLLIQSK